MIEFINGHVRHDNTQMTLIDESIIPTSHSSADFDDNQPYPLVGTPYLTSHD